MKGQVKLEPQPSQPNPEIVVVTTFFSSARFLWLFQNLQSWTILSYGQTSGFQVSCNQFFDSLNNIIGLRGYHQHF